MSEESTSNALMAYCREHRVRLTPQRMEIYEEISRIQGHPSAEEIFTEIKKKFPHISIDTVYRNLGFFEKIGILSRVRGQSSQVKRFETNHDPHHHFCCERCQKLYDLTWEEFDRLSLPSVEGIGRVSRSSATLYGVCRACLAGEPRE